MDDAAIKETRRVLRQVQDHLLLAHAEFGAVRETINLVEVIYHPTNPLADFNYVMPRRNTAWVSAQFINEGLERLRVLGRAARVQYVQGLFPAMFARILRDIGLVIERETPLMIYGVKGMSAPIPDLTLPPGVQLQPVTDQRGRDLWWHVWRNAFFDVFTLGVEPLAAETEQSDRQQDIILYGHGFPVGVVRVTFQPQNESAHVVALALQREDRTPERLRLLLAYAVQSAAAHGCKTVFAPGDAEEDRRVYRELGFVDLGSILCYAAPSAIGSNVHDELVQPLLAIRG